MAKQGKLLLLPNLFDEAHSIDKVLPPSVGEAVQTLEGLIAESEKMGRRYLRKFISHEAMQNIPIRTLNEHTDPKEYDVLLEGVLQGEIWGVISDAGLPCIADPGSDLVHLAHLKQVCIETYVGPCSLIMALQLSGFPGQQFSFHGYLPRDKEELEKKLKELEGSAKKGVQIWIEAPYRSQKMLEKLKESLHPKTNLCIAASLEFPNQRVESHSIEQWKKRSFTLSKEPAIFLIYIF